MKRSVLTSGSTRGIDLATAAEFLRHGDRVTVLCRHPKHVDQAVRKLSSIGEKRDVLGVVGDVRTPSDVAAMTGRCPERFGKLDILVNNAGVAVYKPIAAATDDDLNRIIDTNLKGTFLFLRQAAGVMRLQKQGIIINISSGLGRRIVEVAAGGYEPGTLIDVYS